jgi:hypothetical protein
MANVDPSQAASLGRPAQLSETIISLADGRERVDWPHDVVSAMQMLKAHADRLQALIDTAAESGTKIGDLAARMDAAAGAEPACAGEAW